MVFIQTFAVAERIRIGIGVAVRAGAGTGVTGGVTGRRCSVEAAPPSGHADPWFRCGPEQLVTLSAVCVTV